MRLVIKVGSNVLTRNDGKLDITRMSAIVDQIAALRRAGHEVVLVSSGAVASGYGIPVGQVLTMKESFATRREYLNQRACMAVMLDNGVIPIVNENDTVSVTELMFTDNDELSGLIAAMTDAGALVILSNVDGIFDAPPGTPGARLIERVEPGCDLGGCIGREKSGFGRGGMLTKCAIARKVAAEGIRVVIANGRRDNILTDLVERPDATPHTEFAPNSEPASTMKKWIAHSASFAKGVVRVNAKAAQALRGDRAVSLLLVGVTAVEGDFEEGDIITIAAEDGTPVGVGRTAYGAADARRLMGTHDVRPLVHYDYLCLE